MALGNIEFGNIVGAQSERERKRDMIYDYTTCLVTCITSRICEHKLKLRLTYYFCTKFYEEKINKTIQFYSFNPIFVFSTYYFLLYLCPSLSL